MRFVRTEDFDLLEIEEAAEILEMRARLPTASEESEHFRFLRREILRTHGAQRRHAHFLNHAVRDDRDGFDPFNVEKNDEAAITIPGCDGQDAPALYTSGERM